MSGYHIPIRSYLLGWCLPCLLALEHFASVCRAKTRLRPLVKAGGLFFVFGMIDMNNNEDEDRQPNQDNAWLMTMENLYGKEYVVELLRQIKDEKPDR